MTEKLKEIIKEELVKLPKDAQDAINYLDWASITEGIGKKNLLTESEINDLQTETLLVLSGLENLDSYAQNIENEIGTSKDEAEKIASEAIEKIFTPIGNLIEEKIKNDMKNKNQNWNQNVNFVLSGGDYSAFAEDPTLPPPLAKGRVGEGSETGAAPLLGTTRKIEDLKSKFTI